MKGLLLFSLFFGLTAVLLGQSPDVVAKVDGIDITVQDVKGFDENVDNWQRELSQNGRNLNRKIDPNEAERRLDKVIENKLMLGEAKKAGLEKDPELQAEIERSRDQILLDFYYRKVLREQAKPTAEQVRKEYDESGGFMRPARAKVINIWASSEDEARKAIDKLKTIGEKYTAENGTAAEEIDIPDKSMVDEFQKMNMESGNNNRSDNLNNDPMMQMRLALIDAKPDDIIGPMGGNGSFLVTKVIEKNPAGKAPFDEVKEQIENDMTERAFQELLKNKIAELRASATITVYHQNLTKAFK